MKYRVLAALAAVTMLALATTGSALAHASLTHANIKNGQTFKVGHTPRVLEAFFAENLDPRTSWINVFEGIADHGLVNEKTRSKLNFRNPRELVLQLPKLAADRYYFIWYTHSAEDGHFAAGIVYFTVTK
ncbi:MAG TPA: copper resistance protein CopC [Chloroflexota bacterium]|nr:copper resistance protein CopC [Chloroflexota bacterium]